MTGPSNSIGILPRVTNSINLSCKHGDIPVMKINDKAFKEWLELCKFSLFSRVFLSKGDKLWLLHDLILKLQTVWNIENLRLILIGCEYYQVLLTSKKDKCRI